MAAVFDRRSWLRVVESIAEQVDGVNSAIGPFGFEVTGDEGFLARMPHRYFLYLACEPGASVEEVESRVATRLVDQSLAARTAATELAPLDPSLVITPAETIVLRGSGASVYVRAFAASPVPILEQYAQSLALAPFVLRADALPEERAFARSSSGRRYVLQLFLLLQHLYPHAPIPAADDLHEAAELIRGQAGRDPATGARLHAPASERELRFLSQVLRPHVDEVVASLEEPTGSRPLDWVDMHDRGSMTVLASAGAVGSATRTVMRAYGSYGLSDSRQVAEVAS